MKNSKEISMADKIVIDTFAWVEYFLGSPDGDKVKNLIEGKDAVTPTIVIAELSAKYLKEGKDFNNKLKFIKFNTNVAVLNDTIAELSGKIKIEQRKNKKDFGIVDSIVYATALILNANVITGDPHFKDMENVVMIR